MFKVLTGETKRRVISPATITASVAAHLLLVAGAVFASGGETRGTGPVEEDTTIVWQADDPPPPPPPAMEPQPPPPAPADEPVAPPVPGEALTVPRVDQVPDDIAPEEPGTPPVNEEDFTRDGTRGDYIGPVTDQPAEPTGNPAPTPAVEDFVPGEDMVEVRPVLDRNGLARALERNYPALLRDSRVSGRVLIELIVEANGRPRAGSARVVDASHPAFGDAALRAVERFRFRPARIGGTPVPVRVTIPIVWTAN